MKITIFAVLFGLIALASAQFTTKFPRYQPFQVQKVVPKSPSRYYSGSKQYNRGSTSGQYGGNDGGSYKSDNSGSYKNEDGQYRPDNAGTYVHTDSKYAHLDSKYQHDADKFGKDGSNFGGSGGNGGFGPGGGQYSGNDNGGNSGNSGAGNNYSGNRGSGSGVGGGNKGTGASGSASSGNRFGAGASGNKYGSGSGASGSGIAPAAAFGAPVALVQGSAAGKYDNRNYAIIRKIEKVEDDGYHYEYETENGITGEEQGKLANVGTDDEGMRSHGYYTYTGPDNIVYTVKYTSDENGFVPEGAHIPTPPPIPAQILRALEYQRSIGTL